MNWDGPASGRRGPASGWGVQGNGVKAPTLHCSSVPSRAGVPRIRNCHPVEPFSKTMPGLLRWSWGGGQFLMSEVALYRGMAFSPQLYIGVQFLVVHGLQGRELGVVSNRDKHVSLSLGTSRALAYLAHKKTHPPPRTTTGPQAKAYCRVLGGGVFL